MTVSLDSVSGRVVGGGQVRGAVGQGGGDPGALGGGRASNCPGGWAVSRASDPQVSRPLKAK